tara:strand:+ start:490 stop:1518 length:1029 start_codon:yes stop_codon:yes gene_type:complete
MKEIKSRKKSIIKKIFIKICRLLGYEIIDQSDFFIPTLNKSINEKLSIKGKKSINLPLGEVKITRKVKSLDVIIRTCSSVNMLTQNKSRIFEKEKIDYTLRSINSILRSIKNAKKAMDELLFTIYVVDHNSDQKNLDKIKNIIEESSIQFKLYNLNLEDFKDKIKKTNQKNENVTSNQISNMSNIYKSLQLSKENSSDLVYFVEDDYIHEESAISEMIITYERMASLTNKELILCPADYPYLYTKAESTQIYLGEKYHWRKINETLCTFLTSKKIVEKHWKKLTSMCEFEHYPFESPLHKIYEEELCISPIPSLAIHCTNVNSVFGLSPNVDWKKLWEENKP